MALVSVLIVSSEFAGLSSPLCDSHNGLSADVSIVAQKLSQEVLGECIWIFISFFYDAVKETASE